MISLPLLLLATVKQILHFIQSSRLCPQNKGVSKRNNNMASLKQACDTRSSNLGTRSSKRSRLHNWRNSLQHLGKQRTRISRHIKGSSCGVGLQPDYKFIWTWRSDKFGGSKGEINQTTPPSFRSAQTTGKNLWEEPPEICLKKKHELVNFLNRNTEGSLAVQTSGNGVFRVSLYKIPEKCRWGGHAPIFALLLQWKQINKLTKRFNR